MSDLKLTLFPSHLLKNVPDLHGFLCQGEWLAYCPPALSIHLGSFPLHSPSGWFLLNCSLNLPPPLTLSYLRSDPWPALCRVWQQLPHPGVSFRVTPHSISMSSPPKPQDQPTHCSTAKQAPNPPTTPGFPKSSLKTLKWPSRQINLHPTNNHPSQDSPFMLYKVTLLAKQC